jgi:hypothetical protein
LAASKALSFEPREKAEGIIQMTWILRKDLGFRLFHPQLTLTLGQILNALTALRASRICPAGIRHWVRLLVETCSFLQVNWIFPKAEASPAHFKIFSIMPYNCAKEIIMNFPPSFSSAILCLCIGIGLFAQPLQGQTPPPELAEFVAARRLADDQGRLKELRRIKAAYPTSELMPLINMSILVEESKAADSLEKLKAAQGKFIDSCEPDERMDLLINGALMLTSHAKVAEFPAADVLQLVQAYKAKAMELLKESPDDEMNAGTFGLSLAKAHLLNGESKAAIDALEEYKKTEGSLSSLYYKTQAEAFIGQKRDKDALEAFISAHVEGDADSLARARELHAKLNKGAAGFEAMIERRQAELPFHPEPFAAPADWKGKVALAELFTGSECPPCVGADFAFDGLIDAYPVKYLAILEYHLPIPRPDPMMNPASNQRGNFYGIRSTPTVVIDGNMLAPGGGGRAAAKTLFEAYKDQIDSGIAAEPIITISAKAELEGENLRVDCEFSKIIEGAQYIVAFVQGEEKYKGSNGIIFHKMVARDIKTVPAASAASATFNIAESVKATDEYLSDFEKTSTRFKDFKFPARHHKIDWTKLKAIVFVQDPETKQVYNAVATDVAIKK